MNICSEEQSEWCLKVFFWIFCNETKQFHNFIHHLHENSPHSFLYFSYENETIETLQFISEILLNFWKEIAFMAISEGPDKRIFLSAIARVIMMFFSLFIFNLWFWEISVNFVN